MSRHAHSQLAEDPLAGSMAIAAESDEAIDGLRLRARPIPRVSIQAFCEDVHTAGAVESAAEDRRLAKPRIGSRRPRARIHRG
jgi:pilus assembly protein CpaE